ncbi:MAG TPA: hypothetical protein VME24_04475 [Alphaproteobacteria bacterium]|nr:hypothetical protein [Alphaproteobacteria bacterium]
MNSKLLSWGIALMAIALNVPGAPVQTYQFAVISNSITGGTSFNAVANNGNTFVCVGGVNAPIVTADTTNFGAYRSSNIPGGYLLSTNAWAHTHTVYSLNSVAMTQPGGFVASGGASTVFTSSDGVTWATNGSVVSGGSVYIDGIAYNPFSGKYTAAASRAAYYTANPLSGSYWTASQGGFTFAESFQGVASSTNENMAMCGILGDIRVSSDGGTNWGVGQVYSINYSTLFSIASDGNSNLVSGGDFSLLEVSTNIGIQNSWNFQNNFNVAAYPEGNGGGTNFNVVAYSPLANQFLAAGTMDTIDGTYGLILMAPNTSASANWTWTSQNNVTAGKNGELTTNTGVGVLAGTIINGASFASSNFFQGIVVLAATNGTIIVGGVAPPAPENLSDVDYTNVLANPQNNSNLVATVVPNPTYCPSNDVAVDWYSTNSGGTPLGLNTNPFQPTNDTCGAYTDFAQERDLRTGFTNGERTAFSFTIIPPAPISFSMGVTNILTSPDQTNSPIWVDVFTNAANPATDFSVNWFANSQGSSSVNNGTETNSGNQFYHTPTTGPTCGFFTNWAQTVAKGPGLASTNLTQVTFVIIPAAPTSPVNETNCLSAPISPLSVTVPAGQTVNWYSAPTGGSLLATGLPYTPAAAPPGVYTNWAEAQDTATGLVSTNRTAVVFQVNPLPLAPANPAGQTNLLTAPNQLNSTLTVSVANSSFIGEPVTVDWYMDSGGVDIAYTATNNSDPNWISGGGVVPATGTLNFIPTNRICGIYTYYARARVVNPACSCLDCVSAVLTPVTFVLLPPAPDPVSTGVTNVLTGSDASNLPVWAEVLTNFDNSWSNFVVNWYTNSVGSNSLSYLNNGTETNLANQFFHTPTNTACGVYTIWAETMATNTSTGVPLVSPNRFPVTFVVIPAAPVAVGSLAATNCTEVPNPTFTVSVTNYQTAVWYNSGVAMVTNVNFTPTDSSLGTSTYSAEALDTNWNLYSTGSVTASLTLSNCTSPVTININPATGTGTIQWPGNLVLLSSTNLVDWTIVSTGSVFVAPNTLSWTNTNPPVEFFRLTN